MSEFLSWSVSLGTVRGTRLRVHLFFLLFVILTLYASSRSEAGGSVQLGLECSFVLLLSVVVHEVGHGMAAHWLGGSMPQMVLAPWGGLADPHLPAEPRAEFLAAAAGPAANLFVAALLCPALVVAGADPLAILLHPLRPVGLLDAAAVVQLVKLSLWIHWLLALVNLIPAFPFDGGRALRALLAQTLEYRWAVQTVARLAKVVALGLAIWTVAWPESFAADVVLPPGVPLLLLAIILYFSAQHESTRLTRQEAAESMSPYDFSQGYTSLERSVEASHAPGPVRRWLARRRALRRQRQLEKECEEERQLDLVLARLADVGMNGLSPQERSLLERVSQRYRNRQC